ncbi:hypothetical protein MJ575_02420 [Klebsiella pneumoniae]|nr:hypothetical protein MJ575_02420 [Klebsiella pneumoniae]
MAKPMPHLPGEARHCLAIVDNDRLFLDALISDPTVFCYFEENMEMFANGVWR